MYEGGIAATVASASAAAAAAFDALVYL